MQLAAGSRFRLLLLPSAIGRDYQAGQRPTVGRLARVCFAVTARNCKEAVLRRGPAKVIYLFFVCLDDEKTSQVMAPATLRRMALALPLHCGTIWRHRLLTFHILRRAIKNLKMCKTIALGIIGTNK